MEGWLDLMEAEGSLVFGQDRYSSQVRAELLAMSAATIDRYLAPVKASSPIRGKTTTRSGSLLRTSITTRSSRRGGSHRARLLRGRYRRPLRSLVEGRVRPRVNFTCVHIGWVFTSSIRDNARVHVLAAFDLFVE